MSCQGGMDTMKEIVRRILFISLVSITLFGCQKKKPLEIQETKETKEDSVPMEERKETKETKESTKVCVYVCGSVNRPGVYTLEEKARLCQAIEAAGGVKEDAAQETLNQAREVVDGERIYVPSTMDLENGTIALDTGVQKQDDMDGKININTAGKEELMTLPGIGQSKAELILSYRESKGNFEKIEELMEIEGIKEGVFNKIKDKIIVAK